MVFSLPSSHPGLTTFFLPSCPFSLPSSHFSLPSYPFSFFSTPFSYFCPPPANRKIYASVLFNCYINITHFVKVKLNFKDNFISGKWLKNVVYDRTALSGGLVVELVDLNLFGFPVKVVCRDIEIINRKLNNFRNIMSIQ